MNTPLKLALPVMLHDAIEVEAFKLAKPRLERYLASMGIPCEVGVFVYMRPHTLENPELRKAQLATQERENFPVYHAQTPIISIHSLEFYGRDPQRALASGCLLENALEHAGELASRSPSRFDVDVHSGVFVYPDVDGSRELGPGTFTVDAFLQRRELILENTIAGFQRLEKMASSRGLGLLLENEPIASYESGALHGYGAPRLIYKPFGTPLALDAISANRTFDTAHFASTANVPEVLGNNDIDPAGLFELLEISANPPRGWARYRDSLCRAEAYLAEAPRAIHLSNFQGIGVHLEDPGLQSKWGKDGTNEGTLTPAELRGYLDFAWTRQIPLVLEVDFDVPNIGANRFVEADDFFRHIFRPQS